MTSNNFLNRLRSIGFVASALLAGPGRALACSMCSSALDRPSQAGMAGGYYWSILFMLGVVFSLVGTFTFFIVRAARRESSAPPPGPPAP